ncbi:hypothetical protein [Anaerosolibacter sp.]|uniref:hypothetical protein n=1 Tax=Anaerosolibacter sp. TaxID=1872527 RepID=UPI0039EFC702
MMTMFYRKSLLRSTAVLAIVGATLLSGCASKAPDNGSKDAEKNKPVVQEDSQEKIMADFNDLLKSKPKADAMIQFIDKNIANLSKENASVMMMAFEEIQKSNLPALEEKYFNGETVQSRLAEIYMSGFDITKFEDIQDEELKGLLMETKDTGYKVETAEGTFFPIINYEFYKKFSGYVSEDIKDYIDIMAVESNNVPAKDAALVIGWDEIIERALTQEKFIKKYESAEKTGEVEKLYEKYVVFMLYGANNTPLFSYETKVMVPDAKAAYENALKNEGDSETMKMLGNYMDVLDKTDYKVSDEAEKFRKDAVERL